MSFWIKMNFESPFQNLFEISKCAIKQCCRELNFGQLLFLGQLLKMNFWCSKWEKWGLFIWKIKRKIGFYRSGPCPSFLGPRPKPARPVHPACLPLPRTAPAPPWPRLGRGRHMELVRWRRPTGGAPRVPPPRPLEPVRARSHLQLPVFLLSRFSSRKQCPEVLAGAVSVVAPLPAALLSLTVLARASAFTRPSSRCLSHPLSSRWGGQFGRPFFIAACRSSAPRGVSCSTLFPSPFSRAPASPRGAGAPAPLRQTIFVVFPSTRSTT
jgi:hypothetical protein